MTRSAPQALRAHLSFGGWLLTTSLVFSASSLLAQAPDAPTTEVPPTPPAAEAPADTPPADTAPADTPPTDGPPPGGMPLEGGIIVVDDGAGHNGLEEGTVLGTTDGTTDESDAEKSGAERKETNCSDGLDDDGDTVFDCADHDCAEDAACQTGGNEGSEKTCSDWIDNDGDGFTDCDDVDCQIDGIKACQGSWAGPVGGQGPGADPTVSDDIPELGAGMSVEDLIGRGDDKDGERNDQVCSDGVDNDLDGKIDCADIGCRFDPQVTVCRGTPGIRFSMVANISHSYLMERDNIGDDYVGADKVFEGEVDTRFTALQLRAFGPLPGIQESFFLISGRAEKTPRMTFAMAQFPIWGGHFVNINSGGGGLSNALVLSGSKRLLIDAPFYVYNAFEQGNGAAIEFNGPIWPGWVDYRVYAAGGSGLFNGNLGGRFFSNDNTNYTWSTGVQTLFNIVGYISRWDSMYLYTNVPMALGINFGVRYDQRAQERFPAVNVSGQFRWWRFITSFESYTKYELEYETTQTAGNLTAGMLVIPKWLMIAGDIGGYWSSEIDEKNLPEGFVAATDLRRQRLEFQWRLAAHVFVYKNIGVVSAVFKDQYVGTSRFDDVRNGVPGELRNTREIKLVAQFRF